MLTQTFTQTHTYRNPSHTQTIANISVQARTPADRQTDIWKHTQSQNTVLSQVSDDIVMIILERFKHCYTHTGSRRSDCASQSQPGLLDFDIKAPLLFDLLCEYTHVHSFSVK